MRFTRTIITAAFACSVSSLAACATTGGPDALVHMESHGKPVENGKSLNVRFDELERNPDDSIVELTFDSGGSVSSSMFMMRGVCAVAMARDARYVLPKPVAGYTGRYRLTFYAREDEAPTIKLPHRDGKPDRTRSEAISKSMCGMVNLLTSAD